MLTFWSFKWIAQETLSINLSDSVLIAALVW